MIGMTHLEAPTALGIPLALYSLGLIGGASDICIRVTLHIMLGIVTKIIH